MPQACAANPKHRRQGSGRKLRLAVKEPPTIHNDRVLEKRKSYESRKEVDSDESFTKVPHRISVDHSVICVSFRGFERERERGRGQLVEQRVVLQPKGRGLVN